MRSLLLPAAVLVLAGCSGAAPSGTNKNTVVITPGENPRVVIETSLGNITAELFADKSPATVQNFLGYVDEKHYDGTIFHRVIPEFMIQGGGFTEEFRKAKTIDDADKAEKKTRPPVRNEAANGVKNTRGTLAMARTRNVDSASAQFYINTDDNPNLDHRSPDPDEFGYCVFGRVVEGMDVVEKIRNVPTIKVFIRVGGRPAFGDVPEENVVIKSVRRVEKK